MNNRQRRPERTITNAQKCRCVRQHAGATPGHDGVENVYDVYGSFYGGVRKAVPLHVYY